MTSGGPPAVYRRRESRVSWRAIAIALISTIVVVGAIVLVVTNAPGWPEFKQEFLNGPIFWSSLPGVVAAFWNAAGVVFIAK